MTEGYGHNYSTIKTRIGIPQRETGISSISEEKVVNGYDIRK